MIQELEQLVRDGKFKKALAALKTVRIADIPRREILALANIAGRIGELNVALKVLNPVIRGENLEPATNEEKLQYANCLRKLGAVEEALEIISGLPAENPEALIHKAFCLQSQWKYKDAIPALEQAIRAQGIEPYRQTVAKVNLLAAYVNESLTNQALQLSQELLVRLDGSTSTLLHGNVLELAAQIDIQQSEFAGAFSKLEKAKHLLKDAASSNSAMFIEKWMAVAQSLQSGKVTPGLLAIKDKAAKLGHWETLRDCEFYEASLTQDRETLIKLYFGTPHGDFRRRIVKMGVDVPDHWTLSESLKPNVIFDIETATMGNDQFSIEAGQASHRLLIILSQDFYRPYPVLSLFSRLFPGEYFIPDSSANRVHQILKRFRKIDCGIEAEELAGSYRLKLDAGVGLRLRREGLPLETEELRFLKLRSSMQTETFTTEEAVSSLKVSRTSAQRLLKWATDNHRVEITRSRTGNSKIRFKFVA